MDVKVLGPLEVQRSGASIVPSAAKPRQVFALLALNVGQVVTVSTLMDELWGTELPRSAATTLQTYILQLRRRLGATASVAEPRDAKAILVTRYAGYQLDIPPTAVDVHAFDQLAERGRCALAAGDDASASRFLTAALDLWRGPALVDVRVGTRLEMEVLRLHESRLGVLESRIEADLRLGRHHELLSELATLVARYPMNENLCAQHMVALYRSGRCWQALDAFNRLRATLVDELGVEPSAGVQRTQMAILNADPALDCSAAPVALAG